MKFAGKKTDKIYQHFGIFPSYYSNFILNIL